MKTQKKIIYENNLFGIRVQRRKNNKVEIIDLENGCNIKTPGKNGRTEFLSVTQMINGLRIKLREGLEMIFLFNKMGWFFTKEGNCIFKRAFILGDVEASRNGEQIKNYSLS